MSLSREELQELRAYKNSTDDENIRFKDIIKHKLLNDRRIIHVLNNKSLNEDEPDSYYLRNIFPTYILPNVIVDTDNYICFDTKTISTDLKNGKIIKTHYIIFHILCDAKTVFDKETGICRHDLLAALIKDNFAWTNDLGHQLIPQEESPSVVDDKFSTRTLMFAVDTTNAITRGAKSSSKVINR